MRGSGLWGQLSQAASAPGGFRATELQLPGVTQKAIRMAATQMANIGKLHRAVLGHRNVRYFDDAERAAAYELKHRPAMAAPVVVRAAVAAPKGEAKVPAGVPVTEVAAPRGRYEVDPASIKPGSFLMDLPPGRWSDYVAKGN